MLPMNSLKHFKAFRKRETSEISFRGREDHTELSHMGNKM